MIVSNWSLDKFWAFQTDPLLLYTFMFSWWCPLFRLVDLFLPPFLWLGLWSCYIDVHMHKVWYLFVYIHNIIYICVQLGRNIIYYQYFTKSNTCHGWKAGNLCVHCLILRKEFICFSVLGWRDAWARDRQAGGTSCMPMTSCMPLGSRGRIESAYPWGGNKMVFQPKHV